MNINEVNMGTVNSNSNVQKNNQNIQEKDESISVFDEENKEQTPLDEGYEEGKEAAQELDNKVLKGWGKVIGFLMNGATAKKELAEKAGEVFGKSFKDGIKAKKAAAGEVFGKSFKDGIKAKKAAADEIKNTDKE